MDDGVEMKEGKVMVMKGANTMELKEKLMLKNGTVVMADGSVKTKGGKMMQLKEGKFMDMNGKMDNMKMDKMEKMEKSKM